MSEHSVMCLSLSKPLSLRCSFTGKAEADGRMHVTLCDYIMPWDSLSNTQKKGLSQRYQMGCECKVRAWRPVCVSARLCLCVCGCVRGLSPRVSPPEAQNQT